ncbi:MAG: hypothetical protein FWF69_10295, partial [Firmicutes bacterium]|nr:hypothetical protein [Bacillota bacterium]
GGCGIEAPACCKLTLSGLASASGGPSPYDGGCGMDSHVCGQCGLRAQVLLCDHATLSGGVGEAGGAALQATRAGTEARREAPDVVLSGECMLLGAAGDTAGAALRADACAIAFDGSPTLVSGFYRLKEAPVMKLTNCVFTGGIDKVQRHEGEKSEVYPARDVPQIILSALGQQSGRYTPKTIEDGLNTRELSGRLDGHAVEKGSVSQASLDGKGLLITMWNRTLETKLRFREYLMPDGTGGLRLVCIAVTSLEWPTVRSSVAALRKLQKEGFTQLAYSNAEPVYNERVIDIPALLEAIDAYQRPVRSVFLGTADDAVIFLLEDEALVYQEGLMEQIVRPLEAADAENGM